jgi:hypothetical protein
MSKIKISDLQQSEIQELGKDDQWNICGGAVVVVVVIIAN